MVIAVATVVWHATRVMRGVAHIPTQGAPVGNLGGISCPLVHSVCASEASLQTFHVTPCQWVQQN